jgi:hypothetical protein
MKIENKIKEILLNSDLIELNDNSTKGWYTEDISESTAQMIAEEIVYMLIENPQLIVQLQLKSIK